MKPETQTKKKQYSLYVEDDMRAKIEAQAERESRTSSNMLYVMVKEYLENHE